MQTKEGTIFREVDKMEVVMTYEEALMDLIVEVIIETNQAIEVSSSEWKAMWPLFKKVTVEDGFWNTHEVWFCEVHRKGKEYYRVQVVEKYDVCANRAD